MGTRGVRARALYPAGHLIPARGRATDDPCERRAAGLAQYNSVAIEQAGLPCLSVAVACWILTRPRPGSRCRPCRHGAIESADWGSQRVRQALSRRCKTSLACCVTRHVDTPKIMRHVSDTGYLGRQEAVGGSARAGLSGEDRVPPWEIAGPALQNDQVGCAAAKRRVRARCHRRSPNGEWMQWKFKQRLRFDGWAGLAGYPLAVWSSRLRCPRSPRRRRHRSRTA